MIYKDLNNLENNAFDFEAINNSIKNILLTRRGSVPGKPRFGSDLYKIVFKFLDHLTESLARGYIETALSEFEKRITVQDIKFKQVPEFNKLIIEIFYTYRDSDFSTSDSEVSITFNI